MNAFAARAAGLLLRPAPAAGADAGADAGASGEGAGASGALVAVRPDDKERVIGLLAAPVAAAISFLVIRSMVSHDPATGSHHVATSLYGELLLVLLALALVGLGGALLRRRLPAGVAFALYGLALFNLHWWGFGVPYVLVGAWMLVRAWRVRTGGDAPAVAGSGSRSADRAPAGRAGVRASRRYTPPQG